MIIEHIHLRNFRNYFNENIEFTPGINLFIGNNGSGKSNLLEAIHYISLGRPIRSSKEIDLINFAATYFHLSLRFKKKDILNTLSIYFSKEKKIFKKNNLQFRKKSDLIGKIMVIPFSPEDADVIRGGPSQRRRSVNILLCSLDNTYLENLRNLKKSIRQRNALLMRIRRREDTKDHLTYWNQLIDYSGRPIMKRRKEIIEKLNVFCLNIIKELNFPYKDLRITYEQSCDPKNILEELKKNTDKDIKLCRTTVGPHRDDIIFETNALSVQKFSSRGQQRLFSLIFRIAEAEIYFEQKKEYPILIIDEAFIELDKKTQKTLEEKLSQYPQVLIASADDKLIEEINTSSVYYVENGKIQKK